MNSTSAIMIRFFKKKGTLVTIAIIIFCLMLSLFLSSIFKQSIRTQEMDAVVQISYKNKQFESINESQFQSLLKSNDLTVIGFINPSDNKAYQELNTLFNQKETIADLPNPIYIYEPIYDDKKIIKSLGIKDKNTFFIIDEKKEIGRYGFNTLQNGNEQLVDKIETIINPKITRKEPIRNEKKTKTTQTQSDDSTDSE